jgi:hypothetical protein
VRKKALWRPMDRIRAKSWMPTDQSPWAEGPRDKPGHDAVIEIYENRHARPCAGHPRSAAGTPVFAEFGRFFHVLLGRNGCPGPRFRGVAGNVLI